MLRFVLLFTLILCPLVICKRKHNDEDSSGDDLGAKLVSELRNDANVDLSADEEYEDLRAEFLAYHTALASLADTRKSMKTTPCWKIGGICIHKNLCEGHHFLSEVNGCRNKLEVCCFTWNNYQLRDQRDKGVGLPLPWGQTEEFGGKGVIGPVHAEILKKDKQEALDENEDTPVYNPQRKSKDLHNPVVVILRDT